jgi:hypothetical protein
VIYRFDGEVAVEQDCRVLGSTLDAEKKAEVIGQHSCPIGATRGDTRGLELTYRRTSVPVPDVGHRN